MVPGIEYERCPSITNHQVAARIGQLEPNRARSAVDCGVQLITETVVQLRDDCRIVAGKRRGPDPRRDSHAARKAERGRRASLHIPATADDGRPADNTLSMHGFAVEPGI